MKMMTCKQLGGACDKEFHANSFDEMATLSQQHGKEMHEANDQDHLDAMSYMQALMQKPGAMQEWFDGKRSEFDSLPES